MDPSQYSSRDSRSCNEPSRMFHRPPARRTLNSVNTGSAFLNHKQRPTPAPISPVDVGGRRTLNSVNTGSVFLNHNQRPTTPAPSSPVDVGYGQAGQAGQAPPSYISVGEHYKPYYKPKARGISCLFFLCWTVLLVGGCYIYFQYFLLPERVTVVTTDQVEQTKHHWMNTYHSLELDYGILKKSHIDLKRKYDDNNAGELERQVREINDNLSQERQWSMEWKAKAVGLEETFERLKRNLKEYHRRQLIQKYGYRTLEVEFEVSFGGEDLAWITVELAPIDEMPHTVFMFMEQVAQGLYNNGGFSFHHNSDHIVMGAPISNHLTPDGVDNLEKFNFHGISNVLLQEYSPNFPHQPYTLGLAGRPSGPDFYININDNTNVHGPGGYAADGQADPCFARITRGKEIIDRIHGMSGELREGDWKDIDPLVAIRSAKILS